MRGLDFSQNGSCAPPFQNLKMTSYSRRTAKRCDDVKMPLSGSLSRIFSTTSGKELAGQTVCTTFVREESHEAVEGAAGRPPCAALRRFTFDRSRVGRCARARAPHARDSPIN
ncbi:hypothetical protein EVAR_49344_1 [Eumeta japonica]|uniref:Uncharacterized protein n=1 Tax=Eumeta variegata TaxID=151549 RepID=A0A4C1XWC0_EUMVA|nr:hypothetical protein EVAR_49344_1 [Eumeta japonica]